MSELHDPPSTRPHSAHIHALPVHRAHRELTPRQIYTVLALLAAVVAVICLTIWRTGTPASSVLPTSITTSAGVRPTTSPGTPIPTRKPVQKAAPVPVAMATDGTYLVGKTIQPGTYTSPGADVGRCYWARLKNTSGEVAAVIAASYHPGRQIVTISRRDKAFVTDGCGPWELMKP